MVSIRFLHVSPRARDNLRFLFNLTRKNLYSKLFRASVQQPQRPPLHTDLCGLACKRDTHSILQKDVAFLNAVCGSHQHQSSCCTHHRFKIHILDSSWFRTRTSSSGEGKVEWIQQEQLEALGLDQDLGQRQSSSSSNKHWKWQMLIFQKCFRTNQFHIRVS